MTRESSSTPARLQVSLLVGFACVPLVHATWVQEHVYLRVPFLLALATLVWGASALRSLRPGGTPPPPPLLRVSALWLGLAAASFLWASAAALVPVNLFRDFVIISGAGAFAMLAAPRRGLALLLMAAGGGLALALALGLHLATGDRYLWRPFFQPSLAGGFAAVMLAGVASALVAARPGSRGGWMLVIGGGLLTLLAVVVLWRTQAQTAAAAALAGVVAGFLALRGRWGRVLAALVVPAAALVGIGLVLGAATQVQHPSAEIRVLLWEGALRMVGEHGYLGVGYGGFGANFPFIRPEGYWEARYATGWSPYPHSLYLGMGAQLGLVGLLLPPLVVVVALWHGLRRAARARTPQERSTSAAVLGAFVAIAVAGVADITTDFPLGRFLFFALGALAHCRTASEDEAEGRPADPVTRRVLYLGVAALLVVQCIFVEPGLVLSRYHCFQGERARQECVAIGDQLDTLRQEGDRERLKQALERRGTLFIRSFNAYQRAVYAPRFPTEWTLRSRLLGAQTALQMSAYIPEEGKRQALIRKAQQLCFEVEELVPWFEDTQLYYALTYFELGQEHPFEYHMHQYLTRRLGWDLRQRIPGVQHGPANPAWEFVLDKVPASSPLFSWLLESLEARALQEKEHPGTARTRTREALAAFRRKAAGR